MAHAVNDCFYHNTFFYDLLFILKVAQKLILYNMAGKKITVSLEKFKMLQPKNVKCYNQTPDESCLCVYFVNVQHKLTCLWNSHPDPKATNLPTNEEQFYNHLLYPRETQTFSNAMCVNKAYEHCKDWEDTIKKTYSTLDQNTKVRYQFWEKEEYTTKKR